MEDFGNIVYVIAAIAWFAWSTYRKSQEGKAKPAKAVQPKRTTETSEESRPFKSLEDLIMSQFGEEEKEQPEPIAVPVASKRSSQEKFLKTDLTHSHLPDDYVMSSGETESHRVVRQVRRLESIEAERVGVMDEVLPDGFDLRQAIVMNAILERPYG